MACITDWAVYSALKNICKRRADISISAVCNGGSNHNLNSLYPQPQSGSPSTIVLT